MVERGKEQFYLKEGVGVPVGPLRSLYQLHLAKDVLFILLPKGSDETGGGNSTSALAKCRQNQPYNICNLF